MYFEWLVCIGNTLFRDNNSITSRMCKWFNRYSVYIVLFSKYN